MKNWISFPRVEGLASRQAHADLPPGTYEYCLVVDGNYIPDPQAQEAVPNPFGGWNSVLKVPGSQETRMAAH